MTTEELTAELERLGITLDELRDTANSVTRGAARGSRNPAMNARMAEIVQLAQAAEEAGLLDSETGEPSGAAVEAVTAQAAEDAEAEKAAEIANIQEQVNRLQERNLPIPPDLQARIEELQMEQAEAVAAGGEIDDIAQALLDNLAQMSGQGGPTFDWVYNEAGIVPGALDPEANQANLLSLWEAIYATFRDGNPQALPGWRRDSPSETRLQQVVNLLASGQASALLVPVIQEWGMDNDAYYPTVETDGVPNSALFGIQELGYSSSRALTIAKAAQANDVDPVRLATLWRARSGGRTEPGFSESLDEEAQAAAAEAAMVEPDDALRRDITDGVSDLVSGDRPLTDMPGMVRDALEDVAAIESGAAVPQPAWPFPEAQAAIATFGGGAGPSLQSGLDMFAKLYREGLTIYKDSEVLAAVHASDPNLARKLQQDPYALSYEELSRVRDLVGPAEEGDVQADWIYRRLAGEYATVAQTDPSEYREAVRTLAAAWNLTTVGDEEAEIIARQLLQSELEASRAALPNPFSMELGDPLATVDRGPGLADMLRSTPEYGLLFSNMGAGETEDQYAGRFQSEASRFLGNAATGDAARAGMVSGDVNTVFQNVLTSGAGADSSPFQEILARRARVFRDMT